MAMQQIDRSLCWLRRDLRLNDQRALAEATRVSREVIPVFVFDPGIVQDLPRGALRRLEFLRESLLDLDESLRAKGSGVMVVVGDPRERIPALARELEAGAVFWNRDYEPWAKRRDAEVSRRLEVAGVRWASFKDEVIFEGGEVLSGKGTPYRVFSAYERAWIRAAAGEGAGALRTSEPVAERLVRRTAPYFRQEPWTPRALGVEEVPDAVLGERSARGGEREARARLREFLPRIGEYAEKRDFPAEEATSGLSPYLRFGCVSVRELFREARRSRAAGARKWESELIWRDFFMMILDQFPQVADGAFNEAFAGLEWPGKRAHLEAWREGRTGYPLVDAAMRCLVRTGWMHNRLRMVTATFLVKDLLIDWREGERFFAEQLLDYELANNNGGWQWCASTGADAQPWFRIFNPVEQSRRFDPEGEFIRRWCPELKNLDSREIHFPGRRVGDYPAPIVDHAVQRAKALELYGAAARAKNTNEEK